MSRSLVSLARQIRQEWRFYDRDWTLPGFRAICVYRFGVWGLQEHWPGVLRALFRRVHRMMFRYVRNRYGIELYPTTVIGYRVILGHQNGIVIHPNAVIGDYCLIRQGVTIGAGSHDQSCDAPRIGNRVHIGCGAAVLGAVKVGDGARIGANAVVTTDIPAGASVFVDRPRVIVMTEAESDAIAPQSRTAARGR